MPRPAPRVAPATTATFPSNFLFIGSSTSNINSRSLIVKRKSEWWFIIASMSRQRTTSDAEVLAAAGRVIARLGPSRFTLADVSAESGLAPATLLQRFGSKRGLLLAFAKMGEDSVAECFAQLRRSHSSAL